MSKFGDLLGNSKSERQETLDPLSKEQADRLNNLHDRVQDKSILKKDAFANLKKTVASTPLPATVGEGVDPPGQKTPSPNSFAGIFDLSRAKEKKTVDLDPSLDQPETGVVDSLQELTTPSFSEAESAKEFQSPDQPDVYTDIHVKDLQDALSILKNSIGNKELITDALKNIMLHLSQHTFLAKILLPEDCQLMTRSLRESYGVVIAKKQTKKTKKTASAAEVDEVMEGLADLDIRI